MSNETEINSISNADGDGNVKAKPIGLVITRGPTVGNPEGYHQFSLHELNRASVQALAVVEPVKPPLATLALPAAKAVEPAPAAKAGKPATPAAVATPAAAPAPAAAPTAAVWGGVPPAAA